MNAPTRLKAMLGEFTRQQEAWNNRDQEPRAIVAELKIADWVQVTGIGLGSFGQYRITESMVYFKGWTAAQIAEAPVWQQPQMLAENEHQLTFPCTPQQLLDFVSNDVSGCLGTLIEPVKALASSPLSLEQQRTSEIINACKHLGHAPLKIPYGGKSAIKALCLQNVKLFTPSTFDKAWKIAVGTSCIRMLDSDKYAGRGK